MRKNRNSRILKEYFIVIVCIFYTASLYGQNDFFEGYIIKNNNDTVYGLIKLGGFVQNAKECVFKKDPYSKTTKYFPSDLLGYKFIKGKYFVSEMISYQLNSESIKKIKHVDFDRNKGTFYLDNETINELKSDSTIGVQNELINKNVFLEYLINGNIDIYAY